jgi:hypothetical protein
MFRNSLALLPSVLVLSLSAPLLQAQDADQTSEKLGGAAPRASAAKYRAHVERDGFSIGAVLISAVRTAWPATRPAHSFLKFRAYPLNVLPSGFRFLDGENPADPLIAREWRNILPFC